MSSNSVKIVCLALTLLLSGFIVRKLWLNFNSWKRDLESVRKGGYCPPNPGILGVFAIRLFSILLGFLEVGPIKVYGKHRIPADGIVILVPLHVDPGDVAFVSEAVGFSSFWYMIRTTEMNGWRGWMGARTGALAIDEESDKGRSSGFKAAVEAVVRKNGPRYTVVFAQGELVQSEQIKRATFKEGFYGLARIASKKLKQPIYVQEMVIHYKRDSRSATLFHRLLRALGFEHFRNMFGYRNFGGVAVLGRPMIVDANAIIASSDSRLLPKDSVKALDIAVSRMKILQRVALKLSNESTSTIAKIRQTSEQNETTPAS